MARILLIVASSCLTATAGAVGLVLLLRSRSKKSKPVPARSFTLNRSASMYYASLKTIKLTNDHGMSVHFTPVGASIQRLYVPDKHGSKQDVVLGFDEAYMYATAESTPYFGCLVGRVANRIKGAAFKVVEDGEEAEYLVLANDGKNALHGGALGLHKRRWQANEYSTDRHHVVDFSYTSPTGEEGYPGEVHIVASYRLAKTSNELSLSIRATTTDPTPVNIAQHSYFNLAGHSKGSTVLDHVLHMPEADHYLPVDSESIPTGDITPVAGTPFDFTEPHVIGERIEQVPGGYDHNWVLCKMGLKAKELTVKGVASPSPRLAATLYHPGSGRALDVLTTAPGVQFYSGNYLDGTAEGKGGAQYNKHGGVCLETQGFPNAVNQPSFPSILLQPEDTYVHEVVYKFYTK